MCWLLWLMLLGLAVCVLLCARRYTFYMHHPLPDAVEEKQTVRVTMFMQDVLFMLPVGDFFLVRWTTVLLQVRVLCWLGLGDYCYVPLQNITRGFVALASYAETANPHINISTDKYDGVSVRVYVPDSSIRDKHNSSGCIVWIHGGGWIIGSARMADAQVTALVEATGLHAVSIDYGLPPGVRFPSSLDECDRALVHYLTVAAARLGVPPERTVIAGDSAGGNLVAALCHRLQTRTGLPKLKAAALVYPVMQFCNVRLPSYMQEMRTGAGNLPAGLMHVFALTYLGVPITNDNLARVSRNEHVSHVVREHPVYKQFVRPELLPVELQTHKDTAPPSKPDSQLSVQMEPMLTDPDFSPLFADDFSGLPSMLVVTAGLDVLRDEGVLYYERLRAAGAEAEWRHFETGVHGSMATGDGPLAKRMQHTVADYFLHKINA